MVEISRDGINAYSDEEIAIYLRTLQKNSLDELLKIQHKVTTEYESATQKYEAERTNINLKRIRYWLLISIGVFREIWQVLLQKKTHISELEKQKDNLYEKQIAQTQSYFRNKFLAEDNIKEIKKYSDEVTKTIMNLDALNKVIEQQDKIYHKFKAINQEDALKNKEMLNILLEERKKLNLEIDNLIKKTERLIRSLVGALDYFAAEYFTKDLLLNYRKMNSEKIKHIQEKFGNKLEHPLAKELFHFLTYRTETSLEELKSLMKSDSSYLEEKELVELIEEAGAIDPRITEDWAKEKVLPSIKETQQEHIKEIAEKLQEIDNELDNLTDMRVSFSEEMRELKEELEELKKEYYNITKTTLNGYLSLEKLAKINAAGNDKRLSEIKEQYRQTDKNIQATENEISKLNTTITEKENEKKQYIINPVLFTNEILQELIQKCKKQPVSDHPVTKALIRFLNYPIPTLLDKLQKAMRDNRNYSENPDIMKLVSDADKYFPQILTKASNNQFKAKFEFFKSTHEDNEDKTIDNTFKPK